MIVNRFEVIDHTSNGEGRILSKREDFNFHVAFDIQDGNRTLKIFLSELGGFSRATLQRGLADLEAGRVTDFKPRSTADDDFGERHDWT